LSVISPGGDAIGSLSANSVFWEGGTQRFTLQMDVGAAAADFFSFSTGIPFAIQMDFRNAGGAAQIGTEYAFADFGYAGGGYDFTPAKFSFSAQSVQSGWSGSFRTQDGIAYVTFASVPEPHAAGLLLLGAGMGAGRRWRQRMKAQD
jgi:hypothetical protein